MINMLESIRKDLKRSGDKEYAARLRKYFKTGKNEYGEGDRFLGIRVPVLRKLAKKFGNITLNEASQLLESPFHEERLFSLFALIDLFRRAVDQDKKKIYALYLKNTKFINNWDLVDASAGRIVGAYLFTRDKTPIYALARSKNLWERRISIMSTSYYIAHNEFADTLKIAEMLLSDEEDLIHKAVGWLLREVGKRDFEEEERFLEKYCECMPRTMLRYAIEKFPEKKRTDYLIGRRMSRNGGDMKSSSDKAYTKFKDYDFSDAKAVAQTPHLAKLQSMAGNKARITMRVDSNVLAIFKARAAQAGGNYQTLMNDALKQYAHGLTLSDVVRDAVPETLDTHLKKRSKRTPKRTAA